MAEAAADAGAGGGSFGGGLNLEFGRQLGLMVGLAASVAVGVAVALWSMLGDHRPLYGSLEQIDSTSVIDVFDQSDINYRIDQREPRISMFIEAFAGSLVSEEQVEAIANLVVSSVPELSLKNVTVVDQRGNLLSNFSSDPRYAEAAKQHEYVRKVEMDILQRVNSLLEPILGEEKFHAEVAAELDFTEREQTAEIYNPDLPAIRSEQTTSEQLGAAGAMASGKTRNEAMRNDELNRTISHTRHQVGKLMRLTVAVAVDDLLPSGSADGADSKVPWEAEDLERLTLLVQNAVGFDAARGDSVTVINTPFLREQPKPLPEVELPIWQQDWFMSLLNKGLGALAFLLLVFLVLRPALKNLSDSSKKIRDLEARHEAALQAVSEVAARAEVVVGEDGTVTLTGNSKKPLLSPDDTLDDSVDFVRAMVAEDPERVAQMIQSWSSNE